MSAQMGISSLADQRGQASLIYKVLVVLAIVGVIGGSLTGVMTYMNVGYTDDFFVNWSHSFLAALVVMPIGFLLMGLITRLMKQLMPNAAELTRNLVTGGLMACIMESLMAFSIAVNSIGFSNYANLFTGWLHGFLAALPLGLLLMVVFSMTIKPKVELFLKS